MPRPTKCRRVCYFPEVLEFSPTGAVSGETIVLTIDELETIRLIDKEMQFSKELIEKAKTAKTAEEMLEMAKAENIELSAEQAAKALAQLKQRRTFRRGTR